MWLYIYIHHILCLIFIIRHKRHHFITRKLSKHEIVWCWNQKNDSLFIQFLQVNKGTMYRDMGLAAAQSKRLVEGEAAPGGLDHSLNSKASCLVWEDAWGSAAAAQLILAHHFHLMQLIIMQGSSLVRCSLPRKFGASIEQVDTTFVCSENGAMLQVSARLWLTETETKYCKQWWDHGRNYIKFEPLKKCAPSLWVSSLRLKGFNFL